MSTFARASKKPSMPTIHKWAPHKYQKDVIKFVVQNSIGGLFLDPGLGKTSIMMAAFQILKEQGLVQDCLVVASRLIAHTVWPGEAEKWENFNDLTVNVLHGPKKDELWEYEADMYVVTQAGLEWFIKKQKYQRWPDMLIIDESTRYKNPAAKKRFKLIKPILDRFKRRYILTGTPIPNGYHDLWSQIYILDGGARLGKYITHYRKAYFDRGFDGFSWELRDGMEKEI